MPALDMLVPRRPSLAAGGLLLVLLVAGCISRPKDVSPKVRVTAAPAFVAVKAATLPEMVETDARYPWTRLEPARFTETNLITFAAAREAYWNADTETAIRRLRELRQADGISDSHYWWLLIQCYEASDRWAESIPVYAELGIEDKRRAWMDTARFMATVPRQELEFDPSHAGLTMNREWGDIVIVEGTVNGTPARLLLDTGATRCWFSAKFARRAGVSFLDRTTTVGDSNNVSRTGGTALIAELNLGGLIARNVFAAAGASHLLERVLKLDGIVGWDVMRAADITWDFPRKLVSFQAPQGPVSPEPNLSGILKPILTVNSIEGERLHLFFDTGAFNNNGSIDLFTNDGVLKTKTEIRRFERVWLPSVSWGLHSISLYWSRRARPFEFWFDGHRFELPAAYLYKHNRSAEELVTYDGTIGNAPFLGGVLKMSGTRREVRFELARSITEAGSGTAAQRNEDPASVALGAGSSR